MATSTTRSKGAVAITAIGAVVMIVSLFLPYVTAEGYSLSVFGILTATNDVASALHAGALLTGLLIFIFGCIVLGAVLAFIFALTNRGIPALIFSVIALLVFIWFNSSYTPNSNQSVGFGMILFYVAAALAVIGSIWMIVAKKKA